MALSWVPCGPPRRPCRGELIGEEHCEHASPPWFCSRAFGAGINKRASILSTGIFVYLFDPRVRDLTQFYSRTFTRRRRLPCRILVQGSRSIFSGNLIFPFLPFSFSFFRIINPPSLNYRYLANPLIPNNKTNPFMKNFVKIEFKQLIVRILHIEIVTNFLGNFSSLFPLVLIIQFGKLAWSRRTIEMRKQGQRWKRSGGGGLKAGECQRRITPWSDLAPCRLSYSKISLSWAITSARGPIVTPPRLNLSLSLTRSEVFGIDRAIHRLSIRNNFVPSVLFLFLFLYPINEAAKVARTPFSLRCPPCSFTCHTLTLVGGRKANASG